MKVSWALTVVPGWLLTQAWLRRHGRSFIVMHTGRVGSVVVGEMLRLHSGILFDHDPLHTRRVQWVARRGPHTPWRENPRWEIMRRPWRARRRVYGVVIKPGNFDGNPATWEAMLAYLDRTLRPKRVALTRHNLLRQVISGCRALEVDQWHVYGNAAPAANQLQAPPDRLPRFFGGTCTIQEALVERERFTAQVTAAAAQAGDRGLHLNYEEHVETDPRLAYRLICELLEIAPEPSAGPNLIRTGNRPVLDLVARPAEWEAVLQGTRWSWMLQS